MRGRFTCASAMALWLSLLLGLPGAAGGVVEVLEFEDQQQSERYHRLIEELRCLVCQNQNLADSDADLATDLRAKAYEMVRAGDSDEQIKQFMTARYGDFVLYQPPLRPATWILWIGPFVLLALGAWWVVRAVGRRRQLTEELSEDQLARARYLLDEDQTD